MFYLKERKAMVKWYKYLYVGSRMEKKKKLGKINKNLEE